MAEGSNFSKLERGYAARRQQWQKAALLKLGEDMLPVFTCVKECSMYEVCLSKNHSTAQAT
jgi:hypothetical protein